MKAPNALKRVGRSIRTKVNAAISRSHTERSAKKDNKIAVDVLDASDAAISRSHTERSVKKDAQIAVDVRDASENDADFLSMLRSGSASMEDVGMDGFDRALTQIGNDNSDQIENPPRMVDSQRKLIQSPPHVKTNPMTFIDDDVLQTLDAAASMARTVSNLMTRSYSKLVEEANSTVQDAVSITENDTEEVKPATSFKECVSAAIVVAITPPETTDSAGSETDRKTNATHKKEDKDIVMSQQESREPPEEAATTMEKPAPEDKVVGVESVVVASPVPTPKPAIVDDEDITVVTMGPDVVLPPTVQNKSDSISGRAPDKTPRQRSVIATALADFVDRVRSEVAEPGLVPMFDTVRDLLCCPKEAVLEPSRSKTSPAKTRSTAAAKAPKLKVASVRGNDDDDDEVSQFTGPDDDEPKPVDSFDEIANATMLVSDMIKIKGSFTSEQCDEVERALQVLEQQAKKIGVNETDLLAAMAASSEDNDESR